MKALVSKIRTLYLENKPLERRSIMKTSTLTWRKIKTDAKIKFYIGINTTALFNKIFRFTQPFLSDSIFWKGPRHAKNFNKVRHRKYNTPKKMTHSDELLLTLMRLTLGLLNEDLAETFGVSPTYICLYIFTIWINI